MKSDDDTPIPVVRRPKLVWPLTEAPRAVMELLTLLPSDRWLASLPGSIDGQPVLTLPGVGGSDGTTRILRKYLSGWGYAAHGWGLGRNMFPVELGGFDNVIEVIDQIVERISARVRGLYSESGQTVSLVGWSIGGIYARRVAAACDGMVRQVITLGTPWGDPRANVLWSLAQRFRSGSPSVEEHHVRLWIERANPPVNIPITAIWSSSDGFVPAQVAQMLKSGNKLSEHIKVTSSHSGFTVNPMVLYLLADRLRQPEGNWQPFRARGVGKLAFRSTPPGEGY